MASETSLKSTSTAVVAASASAAAAATAAMVVRGRLAAARVLAVAREICVVVVGSYICLVRIAAERMLPILLHMMLSGT